MYPTEIVFDLVESEADLNIFFDREGVRAKKPGIIITGSSVGHLPVDKGDRYTLWFGSGIGRWSFKTLLGALAKAEEIMKSAKVPITFRATGRLVKKAVKLLEKDGIKIA